MNNTHAKAIRRDLRRALGEEAIGVIDANTKAIAHQILPNQNALQGSVDRLTDRYHTLEVAIDGLRQQLNRRSAREATTTYWSRLRWLFTGH
jgi:hypothetical protein